MNLSPSQWQQQIVERVRPRIASYFPEMSGREFSIICINIGGDYAKTVRLEVSTSDLRKVMFLNSARYSSDSIRVFSSLKH